jgi:hypothetical protein
MSNPYRTAGDKEESQVPSENEVLRASQRMQGEIAGWNAYFKLALVEYIRVMGLSENVGVIVDKAEALADAANKRCVARVVTLNEELERFKKGE